MDSTRWDAVSAAEGVTDLLTAKDMPKDVALTNAHDYLTLMGHTTIAWVWLRSAIAATRGIEALDLGADDSDLEFYQGKLHTCAFFYRHDLPKTAQLAKILTSKDTTVKEMQPGWF